MAWIESHQTLRDHPKTLSVMDTLGISRPAAVGHLHLFWWWCMDYAEQGDLSRYTPAQIDRAAEWTGKAGKFTEAMIDAGFFNRDGDKITVHDWLDFCGSLIERRLKRANERRNGAKSRRLGAERPPLGAERPLTVPTIPYLTNHTIPDLKDVIAYCRERGKGVDPEKWFDYYTSNGWMVGKNRMKNWQAAVRTWERNKIGGTYGQSKQSSINRHVGDSAPTPGKFDAVDKGI